jgi:hypothetical protein
MLPDEVVARLSRNESFQRVLRIRSESNRLKIGNMEIAGLYHPHKSAL